MSRRTQNKTRQRRGALWTEEDDERLLAISDLPPREIADLMQRSWLACRLRLVYLRASGDGSSTVLPKGTSKDQ